MKRVNTLYDTIHTNKDHNATAIIIPDLHNTKHDASITYSELDNMINNLSYSLLSYGITRHSSICMSLYNSIEFVAAFMSITAINCTTAPLNYNYTVDEFIFYLEDTNAPVMLIHSGTDKNITKQQRQNAIDAANKLNISIVEINYNNKTKLVELNQLTHGKLPSKKSMNPSIPLQPQPDDICLILHTSGTTSKPKAVPLTNKSITTSIYNIISTYQLQSNDTTYLVMPLFHVHGLIGALFSTLASSGCVVIPAKFSATVHWKQFHQYQCTWYSAVPTIHMILLQYESTFDSRNSRGKLRFIRSCSSPLSESGFNKLNHTYRVPICEAYAMTEASHQMTSNTLNKQKVNSVGVAQGTVQLTIRDESDNELSQGKRGEVCIRGDNVTKGYLNNPQANKDNFTATGWFRTGDQGYLDGDRYLYLTGRLKEFINRGGEKISPIEVDNSLLSHPDISEAVAFPSPSDIYGQEVCAAVVIKSDKRSQHSDQQKLITELISHSSKSLAKYKVPKQIFITDVMPKTATGKIQRRNVATHFLQQQTKSKL